TDGSGANTAGSTAATLSNIPDETRSERGSSQLFALGPQAAQTHSRSLRWLGNHFGAQAEDQEFLVRVPGPAGAEERIRVGIPLEPHPTCLGVHADDGEFIARHGGAVAGGVVFAERDATMGAGRGVDPPDAGRHGVGVARIALDELRIDVRLRGA